MIFLTLLTERTTQSLGSVISPSSPANAGFVWLAKVQLTDRIPTRRLEMNDYTSTPQEALEEVLQARDAWLAAAREQGKPIPKPRSHPPLHSARF